MGPRIDPKAIFLFASALLWASSAAAVDGVIEINQAKAIAGGVNGSTASDPPGFPVVISQPGSYRLTGNLDLGAVPDGTNAIEVNAHRVTLDLGGFEISRSRVCTQAPSCPRTVTCAPAGAAGGGRGVFLGGSTGVVIRNGNIRGMQGNGIEGFGAGTTVSEVAVRDVGGTAVSLGTACAVSNVAIERSGDRGLQCSSGSADRLAIRETGGSGVLVGSGRVADSRVSRANIYGIQISGGLLTRNTVEDGCIHGLVAGGGTTIADNVSNGNTFSGIFLQFGRGVIRANTTSGNGNTGVTVSFAQALLLENMISNNTGYGVDVGGDAVNPGRLAYGNNMIQGNAATVSTVGTFSVQTVGPNACDGACP